MLLIAQDNALGERRPRLTHSAFLRLRKNATRRKRVTHYALNATRGVAPHKAGCSYRARHFNQCNIVPPGRCPGLSAAIGLTARHTCAANAVKSCMYMNVFDPNNDNRQTLPRFQPEAIRANYRIVNILQDFGRTRGMTSAQVALGWLLQKAPWIVPIPGTTKLSHLEENLRTLDFTLSESECKELERRVAAIPIVGDRYNAEQQKQVGL